MSSGTQAPASGESIVIFLVIIVLLAMRRIYRSYKGMRFSAGRTLGVVVLYVAIGLVFSGLSFFEGVPLLLAATYAAVILVSAVWSYRYSDSRTSFWRGADGSVYFKGGVFLYLVYIVGLVARLTIDLVVIGPNFLTITPGEALSGTALYATIATDLLLVFGLGLLIGRNVRVFRRYRGIEEGKEALPDSPPPIEPLFGSSRRS